jgi:hypothetical protein
MAPPIGSPVTVTEEKPAVFYGYNADGRAKVKDKPGRGRTKLVSADAVRPVALEQERPQPLSPARQPEPQRARRGWLAAGFMSIILIVVVSMFRGVFEGIGKRLLDWVWPLL